MSDTHHVSSGLTEAIDDGTGTSWTPRNALTATTWFLVCKRHHRFVFRRDPLTDITTDPIPSGQTTAATQRRLRGAAAFQILGLLGPPKRLACRVVS